MTTRDITLNRKPLQLPTGATLLDAAQASGVQHPFAAAVNLHFVHRSQYNQTLRQTGDQVELIAPVTGG